MPFHRIVSTNGKHHSTAEVILRAEQTSASFAKRISLNKYPAINGAIDGVATTTAITGIASNTSNISITNIAIIFRLILLALKE